MSKAWHVIDPGTDTFISQWLKAEDELRAIQGDYAAFVKDVLQKVAELGGKITWIHDEVTIDLAVEKLVELRAWAAEHPSPTLAKRGFL